MTQEQYDQKRAARIERLKSAAEKASEAGQALVDGARKMADVIPLGQPILIGHHSEKRDRAYRGRIESRFRKGFAELDKAQYYAALAKSAAENKTIFSDDPSAAEKLEEKIERLEKRQDLMREANKAIRAKDDDALRELGFSDASIIQLKAPDFCGKVGFADYQLTNNSANIRRLKKRLEQVQAQASREGKEYDIGAFHIVENTDENRVQLFFDKSLLAQVKEQLKSQGFHFSWENTCWQRQLNDPAVYQAQRIAGSQRARYETETETIRSVPENYCLAHREDGKWAVYRHEGMTKAFHETFQKVIEGYYMNEADLAVNLGAAFQAPNAPLPLAN